MGLIFVESSWNSKAVSSAGACGLTQVIPKYAVPPQSSLTYTCEDLKNPQSSIKAGSEILSWWLKEYGKEDIEVGLCGYSMGYKCRGKSMPKFGKNYADKVITQRDLIKNKYKDLETQASLNLLESGKLEKAHQIDFFLLVILYLFFYFCKGSDVFKLKKF